MGRSDGSASQRRSLPERPVNLSGFYDDTATRIQRRTVIILHKLSPFPQTRCLRIVRSNSRASQPRPP
jgi:hypothetical protein